MIRSFDHTCRAAPDSIERRKGKARNNGVDGFIGSANRTLLELERKQGFSTVMFASDSDIELSSAARSNRGIFHCVSEPTDTAPVLENPHTSAYRSV